MKRMLTLFWWRRPQALLYVERMFRWAWSKVRRGND